jgi:hypothetical protein
MLVPHRRTVSVRRCVNRLKKSAAVYGSVSPCAAVCTSMRVFLVGRDLIERHVKRLRTHGGKLSPQPMQVCFS